MNNNEALKDIDEISKNENEIKNNLEKSTIYNGNYKKYLLLDSNWYQKYKNYLNDILSGQENNNFNCSEMDVKIDKKMICYLDKYYYYNSINKFVVIRENYINLLYKKFPSEKDKIKNLKIIFFLH